MKTGANQISKRCIRYFGAWEAEKEERWLNRMAREGWLLTDVSSMLYRFRRVEPKNWVYQLDFMEVTGQDFLDYEQLFEDAGWKYVTTLTNWHYFRSDGDDINVRKIHSDIQSRISVLERVRRMVLLAGIPSFSWLGYYPILLLTAFSGRVHPILIGLYVMVLAVVVLIVYSLIRLNQEIRRMKELGKE
jgi:hypothetical protein